MRTPGQTLARYVDYFDTDHDDQTLLTVIAAIQSDASRSERERCLRIIDCAPRCEMYGRASGGMALDIVRADINALPNPDDNALGAEGDDKGAGETT